jgi:hypothetical protein
MRDRGRSDCVRARAMRGALLILAIGALVGGCAPDAMNNRQATGFNGYLDTIATNCNPLMIGINNVSEWLQNQGSADPNYNYFLDITSRLYYGTVSRDAYRDSITGFFGPGSTNAQSFACIFRNLPAQPGSPPT